MSEISSIGIESESKSVNWKSITSKPITDPVITALFSEAEELFINHPKEVLSQTNRPLNGFIESFNNFLKKNKIKFSFTVPIIVEEKSSSKKKTLSKKDAILQQSKEANFKKEIDVFLSSLDIRNNYPTLMKKSIESFLNILNWAVYLLTNKKKTIDLSIYLDCSISLYRAIEDSSFLTEALIRESLDVLGKLQEIISSRKPTQSSMFDFILNNQIFILDSFWDKGKPKSVSLYEKQKEIISLISSNLNSKKFIFFEMPPANGKTVISGIIAKVIAHKNKENLKSIPQYKKKILLYICYNSLVRNQVMTLCTTHNVDIKAWIAATYPDKENGVVKTFLKPYKSCYPDWGRRNLRTKHEEKVYRSTGWKKYSENISDQWEYYINDTRPISSQNREVEDYLNAENTPEMIISDLESAYTLLSEFPDTFVTYFDEAFAASELDVTARIMSVMGLSVLVSATLAKPEEIPIVINDFKSRHNIEDDSFIHIIKSDIQHISATFIDSTGHIYAPHYSVENADLLVDFITNLEKTPLIKRGYSPDVVFDMSVKIDDHLPLELKFSNVFKYFGEITHTSLRDYAVSMLRHISDTGNNNLYQTLIAERRLKIQDMDVNSIFTNSSIHYHGNRTLHVATSQTFDEHVESISSDFLSGSPRLSSVFSKYEREYETIKSQIASLQRNGNKDSESEIIQLESDLSNIKLEWPREFIMNSLQHASKFGNSKIVSPTTETFSSSKEDISLLDDRRSKLFLSGIGAYQPEKFSDLELDLFLKYKDKFKFILSSPSIVYGTNISLSMIDIDRSFLQDSSKTTLYQLIGRAGRKGRSSSAEVIFRDQEMIDMIFRYDLQNIEAVNVEQNYQRILAKKNALLTTSEP